MTSYSRDPMAQDLVSKMLVRSPDARPTPEQCLASKWMSKFKDKKSVSAGLTAHLDAYKDFSDLKRAALEVVAFNLTSDDVSDLKSEFLAIDTDGSGFITMEELFTALKGKMSKDDVSKIFSELDMVRVFMEVFLSFCFI